MSRAERPTIVVKRIKRGSHAHHGGSWKIAYADFVTAMMAFFLLMWLLGSTTKGDLQGIAEYFRTPLRVALSGGSGSGDSSSVVRGGGKDLSRTHGQQEKTDAPEERRTINLQAARAEAARQELARLRGLKARVEAALAQSARLAPYRHQIKLDITPEGLRIQVVDDQNRPMFDSGSAVLKDYMRGILRELASLLNEVENKISLAGHTDSAPYAFGDRGYSNWELSADRANASRRELVAGGIAEDKIVRVLGLADTVPFNAADPRDPANRRITIVVLNKRTEAAIRGEPHAEPPVEPEPSAAPAADAPAEAAAPAPSGGTAR